MSPQDWKEKEGERKQYSHTYLCTYVRCTYKENSQQIKARQREGGRERKRQRERGGECFYFYLFVPTKFLTAHKI